MNEGPSDSTESIKTVGVVAEIRTEHLLDTSVKRYSFCHVAVSFTSFLLLVVLLYVSFMRKPTKCTYMYMCFIVNIYVLVTSVTIFMAFHSTNVKNTTEVT